MTADRRAFLALAFPILDLGSSGGGAANSFDREGRCRRRREGGGRPKPALRGPFAVCSGCSAKARRKRNAAENSRTEVAGSFTLAAFQPRKPCKFCHPRSPERSFLCEPWCPSWLTEVLAKGCKLTRDAGKDSWFSGRRRVSAVELRLRKLSRGESRHVPRQAAHPDAGCDHAGWPLLVSAGRISGPARTNRSHA